MGSRKEWDKLADDFEREVCDITRETRTDRIASATNSDCRLVCVFWKIWERCARTVKKLMPSACAISF